MNAADFRLALTPAQQQLMMQTAGFALVSVALPPLKLASLTLAAAAAGSTTLPWSRSVSTVELMLHPDQRRPGEPEPLILTFPLSPEQTEQLERLTGRTLTSLAIAPDEYELHYSEPWEDTSALRVGRTLVVARAGQRYDAHNGERVILLPDTPRSAVFGTGRHTATQLILALLEDRLQPQDRVLDVGTGSGILAVAACRLGARAVTALDNDEHAVEVARDTVAVNALADQVHVELGSIPATAEAFDLVLMNVTAAVIISCSAGVARVLRHAGSFLVSGIAASRRNDVVAALAVSGFSLEDERARGDWRAMAFRLT